MRKSRWPANGCLPEDQRRNRLVRLIEPVKHKLSAAPSSALVEARCVDGQHAARKILEPPLVVTRLGGESVGVLRFAFRQSTHGASSHGHQLQARGKLENNCQGGC